MSGVAVTGKYVEVRTSEVSEIKSFIEAHAGELDGAQISIRHKHGLLVAELFPADEPAI